MTGSRWKHLDLLSTLVVVSLSLANSHAVSASGAQVPEAERAKQRSECAAQLRAFVAELDELLPTVKNADPLNEAIGRHFPLYGCDIEEAFEICRQSKYFDRSDNSYPKGATIFFKYKVPRGLDFKISFGLTKPAGDSRLPLAYVDKTGL